MTEVSAAILEKGGKYLICRRGAGGSCAHMWEFPGGKREAGESPQECLERECREELGVELKIEGLFDSFCWQSGERVMRFYFFFATLVKGTLVPTFHEEIRWVTPQELGGIALCEADEQVKAKLLR